MRKMIIFFCSVCLFGCGVNQDKQTASGPLSQMKEFQVVLYADSDQEQLFNNAVEALKQLGSVQIADASECCLTSNRSSPAMLISLGEYQQGSIRVYGGVAIQPNQHKISSQIWAADFIRENLPYPVIEDGKVSFKRDNELTSSEEADMQSIVTRLVTQFTEQYRHDNPGSARPNFYVYRPLFQ